MVLTSMVSRAFEAPWIRSAMKPVASWYCNAAGYRKLGLRLDDLIPEDNDTVQLALKRLPPKEAYDRLYRIRRAVQCSVEHQLLPEKDQTKPEDDVRYLSPHHRGHQSVNRPSVPNSTPSSSSDEFPPDQPIQFIPLACQMPNDTMYRGWYEEKT
ncbi:hypothetical protein MGYG_01777 [Nannizzia gypsea CBS 118893]|uniref:Complex III subunit 7 n=1 Tax=Arthroderma gypseum (strain ATCC MYA-4604 / CBS 118893) TaxID=535722 RepID=E5R3G2_ARTGP|nr:hypothetical protein MGYG_01777 [Nannizzia gypsea CBS 118893]EFQ98761.1 hypothetical protein MGYG_01777 [Nannizzia gypsea CBS 118893]